MATQTKYFTDLKVGDEFQMDQDGQTYRKQSPRKAINTIQRNQSAYNGFAVRAHQVVTITTPDPTPEELAAQRLKVLNWTLECIADRGVHAQNEFHEKIGGKTLDGWHGAFTWGGTIEKQMNAAAQYEVATKAREILNHAEGGIDALVKHATDKAMKYARYNSHSTSPVSNLIEEYRAAAWAEVAEACRRA